MKNSKKGSVMPIVIIGLMMVSVIAFIFLSAVLYGNTAYQTSADELDEKLISARCLMKIRITRRKPITSS